MIDDFSSQRTEQLEAPSRELVCDVTSKSPEVPAVLHQHHLQIGLHIVPALTGTVINTEDTTRLVHANARDSILARIAGGHHYFVAQLPQRAGVVPYVVHATFQYSGNAGKRHRLREAMLWIDPPEYYDHPRGFVTYEPYIPSEHLDFFKSFQKPQLLYQENTTVLQHHFEMMNRQVWWTPVHRAQATSISVSASETRFQTGTARVKAAESSCPRSKAWSLSQSALPASVPSQFNPQNRPSLRAWTVLFVWENCSGSDVCSKALLP
jgi:hypothetical protein